MGPFEGKFLGGGHDFLYIYMCVYIYKAMQTPPSLDIPDLSGHARLSPSRPAPCNVLGVSILNLPRWEDD